MSKKLIMCIVCALMGAAACRYFWPVESKIEYRERIISQNNIRTVVRTVTRPDGTVERIEDRTDKSTTNSNTNYTKVVQRPAYLASIMAGTSALNMPIKPVYGAAISMRVLGPVLVGAYGRTDGEFGLLATLEF